MRPGLRRTKESETVSERIELVPDYLRFEETLGWQPGIWGTLCVAVACMVPAYSTGPPGEIEWLVTACSGTIGLALAAYEIWRRRNRTVLVKDGGKIAVYRKGQLSLTLAPGEIRLNKMDFSLALKIGICLLFWAVALSAIAISELPRGGAPLSDGLLLISIALAFWLSFASFAWVWFSCAHLRLPVKDGRLMAEETVLIRNSRLVELFG